MLELHHCTPQQPNRKRIDMTKTNFNRLVSQDIRAKVRAAQAAQLAAEEARIAELEAEGMSRSDAQAVFEAEQS